MSDYKDFNGSPIDYDRNTGILDSGNRLRNRSMGYSNPEWDDAADYEPEHFDQDCW